MRVLTYGDIMDVGTSVFTSVAKLDGAKLILSFSGVIRVDNPYKHLENYINDLEDELKESVINEIDFDFRELNFCNSNGFYVIMDITEIIYNRLSAPVLVKRLKDDDWQQETLPILLNIDEPEINNRTTFKEFSEL
ncbi:unnamed protein product [marine sediment metagenome]|uniref:STAS domain-containing protein n=1 Tax=marine sediment metagenome TaxID=412755 RepID=X1D3M4_9ZZZZ